MTYTRICIFAIVVSVLSCLSQLHCRTVIDTSFEDITTQQHPSSYDLRTTQPPDSNLTTRQQTPIIRRPTPSTTTDNTPLEVPMEFFGGRSGLFDYPDLSDFRFVGPPPPAADCQQLRIYVKECKRELYTDPSYQPIGHFIRDHYGCDLKPYWREGWSYQHPGGRRLRMLQAATSDTSHSSDIEPPSIDYDPTRCCGYNGQGVPPPEPYEVEEARRQEQKRRIRVCQLSEAAEGCLFYDRLIACVRDKVYTLLKSFTTTMESANNNAKLANAYDQWQQSTCEYIMERGDCVRRAQDVGVMLGHPGYTRMTSCF
eukprot:GHVS01018517.1.p1 GENE.GHVS01018517.1~~GHVS01018517.1.p1  ORF type:complete len:313 (+),score=28.72 GHVS01018517.1:77-1015(+)